MTSNTDALLLLAPGCSHCPTVLEGLAGLVKEGGIGRLEVVNIAAYPEDARRLGVRSVPWCRIGPFELEGVHTPGELRDWARRAAAGEWDAYLAHLLGGGGLDRAERWVDAAPERLRGALPLIVAAETPFNVRLGASALLEGRAGSAALAALVPELGELSRHPEARVRADACHFLGLAGGGEAVELLRPRLRDSDPEVREIAAESLDGMAG